MRSQQYFTVLICLGLLLQSCAPELPSSKISDSDVAVPKIFPKFQDGVEAADSAKPKDMVKIKDIKIKDIGAKNIKHKNAKKGSNLAPVDLTTIDEANSTDLPSSADIKWQDFFVDQNLRSLIEMSLANNQQLNIMDQKINVAKNEIMARQGEYLPKLGAGAGAGLEKVGKITSQGASDEATNTPEHLKNKQLGLFSTWEVDIWKKLRNAAKSAYYNYLATKEGKNFMVTSLVAEIADNYYELIMLDKKLEIVKKYIKTLQQARDVVQLQKEAARATSLAVRRFDAEVLKNQSRQYTLQQQIIITENRLNSLVGRFPQPIARNSDGLQQPLTQTMQPSVPTKLLDNRPDVKQAALKLKAAKLDVKVAKARFYPSLSIDAGLGYESFRTKHFFNTPESLFYNVAANLTAPLLNRMAIKADYLSANNKQIKAIYGYEMVLIRAYSEVANQLASINNLQKISSLKAAQVDALVESVEISNILFKAARIDYLESLLTQRDALKAQVELVDVQKQQLIANVNLYKALGGGWRKGKSL